MQYTQLDSNGVQVDHEKTLAESNQAGLVVPLVVPCAMLQAVNDAWELMTDAEKSLCFSMARRAQGKPLFGGE